ncbi:MAG: undecaprenyl/decaprenyl-phosphate alpha-N-acetylglucosaminyl 1-phosphate transferase [Planctomycetes bacterium]|nr:undecaprenyl/decaprenyl-phosphate alpha-N-acetylglucosaminyl 1-phosphate transferase [Planctomycetota bacterium]
MPAELTTTQVLKNAWWMGAIAFAASLIATPIVRLAAYRAKIVDRPDDLLKPHNRPVAYLGGVAMCAGLLVGLAAYVTVMPEAGRLWADLKADLASGRILSLQANSLWNLLSIGLAGLVIMVLGLCDDIRDISPRAKILGQVLAGVILLAGGVGTEMVRVFFIGRLSLPAWCITPVSALLLIVLVIATCNATNLLDGLDGLCGGVTGIISLGFLALAVWLAMWSHFPGTDQIRVALPLAMAGAVLGFLPYNIPPASIFMGDAGSMLLGFFVAVMIALFSHEGSMRWVLAACAIFALPILDTTLAVLRRLLSGKSIFAGDRSHLYDQLVDRGMTVGQVVLLFYVLALLAAVTGVTVAIVLRLRYAIVLYAVLGAILWVVFAKLGMIRPAPRENEATSDNESADEN